MTRSRMERPHDGPLRTRQTIFCVHKRRFWCRVDHKNKRFMELVEVKSGSELHAALAHITGRENVLSVSLDMSDSTGAWLAASRTRASTARQSS
jgi:hypothetical protein